MAVQEQVVLRPQPGPQEVFLSSNADIALYGGAAGGGKSFALLLEPLRHIRNPRFTAMIFRRTTPMLRNPGGLWDESMNIYSHVRGKPTESFLTWDFPSGANLKMAHLEHENDVRNYQGAALTYIGFDELTHFTKRQFFYMMTRNRSTSGIRPYIRATTNPDADSWVAEFIAWYLNPDTGYPILERSGVIRWFIVKAGEVIWGNTKEEIYEQFPDEDPEDILPKSFTFVPARLEDNPALISKDPGYKASLFAQDAVDRERLYAGNWKIKASAGKFFNRDWFTIIHGMNLPKSGGTIVRFWDLAATERKMRGTQPDYTAGVKMWLHEGVYYVLDSVAVQKGPAEVDKLILDLAVADSIEARSLNARYRVRWEKQPAAAGERDDLALVKMLAGYDCRGVEPQGDKLIRAKALASQSLVSNVKLLSGGWNETWLNHMHGQPDLPYDDIMDASSGAFNDLTFPEGVPKRGVLVQAKTRGWR